MSEQQGMAVICVLCLCGLVQGLVCKWTWGYGNVTNADGSTRMTQWAIISSETLQYKLLMVVYGALSAWTFFSAIGLR